MKRRNFIRNTGVVALATVSTGLVSGCSDSSQLKQGEMMHTVIFDLKHPVGSAAAKKFMDDGRSILTSIPVVRNFQAYKQCSPKNDFQYGFLMTFDNRTDFDTYSNHTDHNKFVKERWESEVTRFQESDFEKL
jgi:hypothetical protein